MELLTVFGITKPETKPLFLSISPTRFADNVSTVYGTELMRKWRLYRLLSHLAAGRDALL